MHQTTDDAQFLRYLLNGNIMFRFPMVPLVACLLVNTTFAESVTFSDGEFNSVNWNQNFYQ